MTEEEAKTKVCPQTFGIPEIRTADGCGVREGGPWNCIGSACMMWQTTGGPIEYKTTEYGLKPEGDGWRRKGAREVGWGIGWCRDVPVEGYCGLAGKP